MSERTTIGGTVYESIGSSNSNLLLKCNGIARIQWGSKLIDLIKNGKIASDRQQPFIFTVTDEAEIKQDGIYILTKDDSEQIWVCKNKNKYDLTNADMYISAGKKQELTSDQKTQALLNIGLYYNTYSDLESANIQNGIAYVVDTQVLYSIKNGLIEDFQAQLKNVIVNNDVTSEGDADVQTQVVLGVNGEEYILLADKRITINRSIYIKNSESISSENASNSSGYRLFIDRGTAVLEVDELRVRNGIPYHEYVEMTYENLRIKVSTKSLIPHQWYLITNFQNHWKLPKKSEGFNRPILIRALTNDTFYETGELFDDRRVKIKYDPTYQVAINQFVQEIIGYDTDQKPIYEESEVEIKTKGRITWMCDENGNEANFDFLDYTDIEKKDLTILYDRVGMEGKTIFPPNSYNNKLTVHNLFGTVLHEKKINNEKTTIIQFGSIDINDLGEKVITPLTADFHDNEIECKNKFIIHPKCSKFYNNKFIKVGNVQIETDIYDSQLTNVYQVNDPIASIDVQANDSEIQNVDDVNNSYDMRYDPNIDYEAYILESFSTTKHDVFQPIIFKYPIIGSIFEGLINTAVYTKILNCQFGIVTKSTLGSAPNTNVEAINSIIKRSQFKNIYNCSFATLSHSNEPQTIQDVSCLFDIHNCVFEYRKNASLYDVSITKEFLLVTTKGVDGLTKYQIKVLKKSESTFFRGMIVMHSGVTAIPEGWAICDGKVHVYDGEEITTPNLVNRFIKGVVDSNLVGEVTNQDLISETKIDELGNEVITWTNQLKLKPEHLPEHQHQFEANVSINPSKIISEVGIDLQKTQLPTAGGTAEFDYIGNVTPSQEDVTGTVSGTTKSSNQEDYTTINIEPQSYALIFIMKL